VPRRLFRTAAREVAEVGGGRALEVIRGGEAEPATVSRRQRLDNAMMGRLVSIIFLRLAALVGVGPRANAQPICLVGESKPFCLGRREC
jgi:hypothetical protein